jgi:Na+/proline symporter
MLAAKSEKDALWGTLFFNVAHYAFRSWPWILVALASILVFPRVADIQTAFPWVEPGLLGHDMAYPAMLSFLPAGWLGLMLAGLFAAYVSTITTHLNWGTSYLVHDLYARFVRPGRDDRHYVQVGRLVTAALMLAAAGFTFVLQSARASFEILLSVGAGTGLLYLLRWYWWRINAWSEIAAMASSFAIATGFAVAKRAGAEIPSDVVLLVTIALTTLVWVTATSLSKPVDDETLVAFYRRVGPAGPGWRRIKELAGDESARPGGLGLSAIGWLSGCALVWGALFATGSMLVGSATNAAIFAALALAGGIGVATVLRKQSS